jgi:sulfhydrogenase subunit beta (sulfur reductase)
MKGKTILKERLPDFIDELIRENLVFAPVKRENITCFDEISASDEVHLNLQNTKKPSKDVLFPKCEPLLLFEAKDKKVEVKEPKISDARRILFGIRPCEARGFNVFDKAFTSDEFKDVYYMKRRENAIVIGMACLKPSPTCFCTSVGGSPFSREGSDLLLVDLGDRYFVDVITEKGEEVIEKTRLFKDAEKRDIDAAEKAAKEAEASIKTRIRLEGIQDKLSKMFDDPSWDDLHQKCVGCGVCTFLCPTCYCFDIVDESYGSKMRRIRVWDTCQFPLFTQQASGVNPRPSGKERMRQRIMHKFSYFPEVHGEIACIGCGRCIRECPVNFDIREVLKSIM